MKRWSLRRRDTTPPAPAADSAAPGAPELPAPPGRAAHAATKPFPALRDTRRPAARTWEEFRSDALPTAAGFPSWQEPARPGLSAPGDDGSPAGPPPAPPQAAPEPAAAAPAAPEPPAGTALPAAGTALPAACAAFTRQLLALAEQVRATLDELEEGEGDPARLEQLYRVDHGVTRMRRAGLELAILAGQASQAPAEQPALLLDVIRMAASAVERYPQVRIGKVAHLAVAAAAADDVAVLLAALLDNAASSSPDDVNLSAHLLDDGAVAVRVDDPGTGMDAAQVAAVNELLAGPVPDLDERAARQPGFGVVHRIARRHGITVAISSRPSPPGGLTVVTVPPQLLAPAPPEQDQGQAKPATPALPSRRQPGKAGAGKAGQDTAPPRPAAAPGSAEQAQPAARQLPRRHSVATRGAPAAARREAATAAPAGPGQQAVQDKPAQDKPAAWAFADDVAAFAEAATATSPAPAAGQAQAAGEESS